jgi:hypothetical protein
MVDYLLHDDAQLVRKAHIFVVDGKRMILANIVNETFMGTLMCIRLIFEFDPGSGIV